MVTSIVYTILFSNIILCDHSSSSVDASSESSLKFSVRINSNQSSSNEDFVRQVFTFGKLYISIFVSADCGYLSVSNIYY